MKCGPKCPRVYEPVCGTDGITYDFSRCELERTSCLMRDDTLQVAYNGECINAALQGCPQCNLMASAVCSSNNITFRSECEFQRYTCIKGTTDGTIQANDSCPNAPLLCPNYCKRIADPVCASNGKTYPNLCELGLADCHARSHSDAMSSGIMFSSFGPCPEGTQDPCSPSSPRCSLNEEPVCALIDKKMTSFFNRCFYEKAVCSDPTIIFVAEGMCTLKPVKGNPAQPQIKPTTDSMKPQDFPREP